MANETAHEVMTEQEAALRVVAEQVVVPLGKKKREEEMPLGLHENEDSAEETLLGHQQINHPPIQILLHCSMQCNKG